MASWGHNVTHMTGEKLALAAELGETCGVRNCSKAPAWVAAYLYTTGQAGRTSERRQRVCADHAARFAASHSLPVPALPLGVFVIYFGSVRDEYAESYSVQSVCDCPQCASPDGGGVRYRLRGEHVRYDRDSGTYERVGGRDLVHVSASSFVPSPEGPQPWQVNQQILRELGVDASAPM